MTESKHTPGPWLYREDKGGGYEVFPYNGGPPEIGEWAEICTISEYNKDPEADARLVAAAPELLEELKRTRDDLTNIKAFCTLDATREAISRMIQRIDAAIAKAEGRA